MTETQDKNKPDNTTACNTSGKKPLSALAEKRAKNLRENLMRRKQQARARSEQEPDANSTGEITG